MPETSGATRLAFGLAAVVVFVALCLHLTNWFRLGTVNWPAVANMLGLFVLMATGVTNPQSGRLRLILTVTALALILPSSLLLLVR